MIINLPSKSDYEKIAISNLVQAFDIIYDTDGYISDLKIDEKELVDEIFEYSQDRYNSAIVLLHQGIEGILKGFICEKSPFFLIDTQRTEWPVLPEQKDKDFNDFYSINPEALLHTYCALNKSKVDPKIISLISEIRLLRNQIVHGISKEKLNSRNILIYFLNTFNYFFDKDVWWEKIQSYHFEHPIFEHYNPKEQYASFASRLDFVLEIVGPSIFSQCTSVNPKQRRYQCPVCKQEYEDELDEYDLKWAFLKPNEPESTNLICYNCGNESEVLRMDCNIDDCKGNVIAEIRNEKKCLTCGYELEEET